MNVIIFILDVAGVALLLAALMLIPRAIYLKVTKKQGRAGVTRGLIAAAFGVSLLMTVNSIVLDTIRGDDTTAQVADEVDQAAINLTAAQQAWDDRTVEEQQKLCYAWVTERQTMEDAMSSGNASQGELNAIYHVLDVECSTY